MSESERGVNEEGEGVYILPPPKMTVVCFLVVPGSSGVGTEKAKHTLKFPGPDHPRSEERRVGKECMPVCRSRWSPYH